MAPEFQDQRGAATSDPSPPLRWLTSQVMRRMVSPAAVARRRAKAEKVRRRSGARHRVEYFHQVDDGYSHLAAQLLRPLLDRYDVDLVCHLVTVARDRNLPEPDLLESLSRHDSGRVAPHYGLRFPDAAGAPAVSDVELATRILAVTDPASFAEDAVAVGEALWAGDASTLESLAARHGRTDPAAADARLQQGNARRAKLGHYSGAMFHCGGEWYWGADRFYHLEQRLIDEGARTGADRGLVCARPGIEAGPLTDRGSLTFEIYPSLRSPYTSLIFDKAVELARDSGVKLVVRPVLPMVMRGVSLTRQKGFYIFSDAAREARTLGLDWGRSYDPIGNPVRNAYSLYPWARKQGKGTELLSSFMHAAFFDGVNTDNERGMRVVVENADLSWDEAKPILGNRDWEDELEQNRLAMYDFGCWGVPSFRLLDAAGKPVLALWGQDRLWLFAREIQRLLREAAGAEGRPS